MEHIKILIVEDEILIAEDLKDILKSFGCKQIAMAHDKKSALTLLETFKPDIALLDIRMEKEVDGLEIGEYINAKCQIPFIYITAHSDVEMIKKIVKTKPLGYITKPFKKSDLFASLSLFAQEQSDSLTNTNQLKVKDGYNTIIIHKNEINYIESDGNYVTIFYGMKKITLRQSMETLIHELNSDAFFKIHRCYVININKVSKFSKKEVHINNVSLPLSRNISFEFENKMNSVL